MTHLIKTARATSPIPKKNKPSVSGIAKKNPRAAAKSNIPVMMSIFFVVAIYRLARTVLASWISRWVNTSLFLSDISTSRRADSLSPALTKAIPRRTR